MRPFHRGILVAVATVSLASSSAAPASQADQVYCGKACGAFTTRDYRIYVSAKKLSCVKARRIQKEHWLGPNSRKVIVNGGHGCCGYILLRRFPGWKCGSGSGGGSCTKGERAASYQSRVE